MSDRTPPLSAAELLRQAREANEIRVTQLANRADVTTTVIQAIEAGQHPVGVAQLREIARAAIPTDGFARNDFVAAYLVEQMAEGIDLVAGGPGALDDALRRRVLARIAHRFGIDMPFLDQG